MQKRINSYKQLLKYVDIMKQKPILGALYAIWVYQLTRKLNRS